MKLDLLIFASHPDDAEIGCAGTICKMVDQGKKVGIVDLTRGELGSRGTAEIRLAEAQAAAKIMGVQVRENLGFRDGFFVNDEAHQLAIIRMIRKYRPEVMLANALTDRHPDHGRGAEVVRTAAFLSGLKMIETEMDGKAQEHWRAKKLFHYVQDQYISPSFVVDITGYYDKKTEALKAFRSQFYDPDSDEPQTYISTMDFWHFLEARARDMGHLVGVTFGEGYTSEMPIRADDVLGMI